jgi:hypothetical protein
MFCGLGVDGGGVKGRKCVNKLYNLGIIKVEGIFGIPHKF